MAKKKHPGGRPPKYSTPEQMQDAVDRYFTLCDGELLQDKDGQVLLDKSGNPIYLNRRPPTITGLALFLGFASRQSFVDYNAKAEFVDVITRAKSRVEQYAAERLYDKDGNRGAQFTLSCHFGWKQQKEDDANKDSETGVILLQPVMPIPECKEDGGGA